MVYDDVKGCFIMHSEIPCTRICMFKQCDLDVLKEGPGGIAVKVLIEQRGWRVFGIMFEDLVRLLRPHLSFLFLN